MISLLSRVTKNLRIIRARKNEAETFFLAKTTKDDYLWHKYGQKSIKNRKYPR